MAIQSSSGGSKPPAPKRLVAPEATAAESDGGRDEGLRPRRLCDYIGQSELKQVLGIAVEATRLRNDALDHVLLYGPQAWAKPPWRWCSPKNWVCRAASPVRQPWSDHATSLAC